VESAGFVTVNFYLVLLAKEGGAILYIYIDPEKTTSMELDSKGRYYLAPGTQYYVTIERITEYTVGEKVTFWVYRVNTAENIEIAQLTVNSNPFDANFSCIFPEDWYEEPVQIKYGTNLETDGYYAQEEKWIDFIVGKGILYVYMSKKEQT